MRNGKYLILFMIALAPAIVPAQRVTPVETDITGLWKGTLYNDTTRQFYRYEVGISMEKGKLTGFSHTWFVLNDTQYFGVKKVKIKRADGKVIIEDAGLIAHNYPETPAKGVRQLNVLELDATDSVMRLSGPFSTNRTRIYSQLTGTVKLERKNDYWQSALVPHLQELGLVKELSFVEDTFSLEKNSITLTARETTLPVPAPGVKAPPVQLVKTNHVSLNKPVATDTSAITLTDANQGTAVLKDEPKNIPQVAVTTKPPVEKPMVKDQLSPVKQASVIPKAVAPAAELDKRMTVAQQTVYFRSDSLQLSLYDNGVVDGDTVSVIMNGEIIMAKQRLSTNAIRKTVYFSPQADSIQLVMYAENLGTIAPNTGLLVVKDGSDLYEIRFSGDLQKNAAVIFKRKK